MQIKELNDRYVSIGVGLAATPAAVRGDRLEARRVPEARCRRGDGRAAPRSRPSPPPAIPSRSRHWRELAVFYKQVRLLYIGIFGFVGAVLVVIVILSAAIVMTMAVTERTREIGTLRALGTRPCGILRMFLAEGVAIAVGGCLAGAVLALVIRSALNASGIILPPPPGATHGMPINVQFYPLAYVRGPRRDDR